MTKPNPQEPGSAEPDNDEVIEALLLAAREEPLTPEMQARCDALMPLVVSGPWHDVAKDLIEHGSGTYFLCKLKRHVDAEIAALVRKLEEAKRALEFYAHLDNHIAADGPSDDIGQSRMWQDKGERARRALAQMEQG